MVTGLFFCARWKLRRQDFDRAELGCRSSPQSEHGDIRKISTTAPGTNSSHLLQDTDQSGNGTSLSGSPRHLFVTRYREWGTEWRQVSPENLEQHLATLYTDRPLVLFGEDDSNVLSTISQPSFVLRLLDMLQPGISCCKGSGNGWTWACRRQPALRCRYIRTTIE